MLLFPNQLVSEKGISSNRKWKYTIAIVSDLYLVARTADNGGEDGARSVITGEAGLAHAGAVVDNQSRNIIVTHGDELNQRAALTENCTKRKKTRNINSCNFCIVPCIINALRGEPPPLSFTTYSKRSFSKWQVFSL